MCVANGRAGVLLWGHPVSWFHFCLATRLYLSVIPDQIFFSLILPSASYFAFSSQFEAAGSCWQQYKLLSAIAVCVCTTCCLFLTLSWKRENYALRCFLSELNWAFSWKVKDRARGCHDLPLLVWSWSGRECLCCSSVPAVNGSVRHNLNCMGARRAAPRPSCAACLGVASAASPVAPRGPRSR